MLRCVIRECRNAAAVHFIFVLYGETRLQHWLQKLIFMEYVYTSPVDTFDNVETLCHATGTLSTEGGKENAKEGLCCMSEVTESLTKAHICCI